MDIIAQLDELIGKMDRFKTEYVDIKELLSEEHYMTAEDVAKALGVSIVSAREYMARADFPKLKVGKGYKVSSTAFFLYNLSCRV